ncbi:MAG: hypothetical protein AAFX53_11650, partial [Bacteroidota bacterium]
HKYEDSGLTIYPGHGSSADIALFDTVLRYIEDFEKTMENSTKTEEAMDKMKELYPTWEQSGFLLMHSVQYHMGLKEEE